MDNRNLSDKIDDYEGMSKEAEEAYNQRQNEPMFKTARQMAPMHQLVKYHENLICGYNKRDGCKLKTRDKSLYACIYHQAMQAVGTDFFFYYNLITAEEDSKMSDDQHDNLILRKEYMQRWMDNFPKGANG